MSDRAGTYTVIVLASVVVVCGGIKLAAPIVVPFLLALFVATVTAPLVLWLKSKHWPIAAAVGLGILVDLAVFTGMGWLAGGSVNAFYKRLPHYREQLSAGVTDAAQWLNDRGIEVSAEVLKNMADPGPVLGLVAALIRSLAGLLSNVLFVTLMVGFMLFEAITLRSKVERALPTS
ncbi:MAG: AI-2E family transporter, partial [Proteobacteria bacterium]|nr:AI-2E family transporter [Pseudomonadota bacterium]